MMGADHDPNHFTSEARAQFGGKQGTAERVKGIKPVGTLDIGKGQG